MRKLQIAAIAVLVAIIALIAYSAVRLYIWNSGSKAESSVAFEPTSGDDFDVEILDQVFPLTGEELSSKKDDGEDTILCVGGDDFAWDYENGLASVLSEVTGMTVLNGSFPESAYSVQGGALDLDEHPSDALCFYNVAMNIASGDFSNMESYVGMKQEDNYYYRSSLETLKAVDYEALDVMVIYYGAEDYLRFRSGYNPDEGKTWTDLATMAGAAASGINAIRRAYPHIRVILVTPALVLTYTSEGTPIAADRQNFGHGTLSTYVEFILRVGEACGVTVLDNYHGMSEEDNENGYLLDTRHFSREGNMALAKHIARVL